MKRYYKSMAIIMSLVSVLSIPVAAKEQSNCSHADTEVVETLEPTCIDIGYTEGLFCNDCSTYIHGHEEIEALGHLDSNHDNICDECGTRFSVQPQKKATCTQEGYTGDKTVNNRVKMGTQIPSTGHKDNNKDYICDVCGEPITKEPITVTLHYYVLNEEYKENISKYTGKNFKVKDSTEVAGCKYITETRQEIQNTEFFVPTSPKLSRYQFAWVSNNTVYTKFIFDKNIELYMSYKKANNKHETGQAGDTAYWIWRAEDQVLQFTGTGNLWTDFNVKAEIPWYEYIGKAKKIVLQSGLRASVWTLRE